MNKERLLIQELSIARGAHVDTEAAYTCEVCRNVVLIIRGITNYKTIH